MKQSNTFISIGVFACACFLCSSCNTGAKQRTQEQQIEKNQVMESENPYKDAEMTAVVIPSEENTFGYDIYVDDAILIHQPSRPGISGNLGFATEQDALKVAELVIQKLRNNEMPPTVTMQELEVLDVL